MGKGKRGKGYSLETIYDTLEQLREHGGNLHATARHTGINVRSIARWRDQYGEKYGKTAEEYRQAHVEKIFQAREEALERTRVQLSEANALDAAKIYGILTDKELLLRGEPTERAAVEIDERIDIRAITTRTEQRLQIVNQLSRRRSLDRHLPALSAEAGGIIDGGDAADGDGQLFVYHQQSRRPAVVVPQQDATAAVRGD